MLWQEYSHNCVQKLIKWPKNGFYDDDDDDDDDSNNDLKK